MKIDLNFFPGWTRKAISFTMDDGWVAMDKKFLDIVNPYGIRGSFNISSQNITKHQDPDGMRELYRGHEITNHVKRHPYAFFDGEEVGEITDAPFDAASADPALCYRERDDLEDGVYQRCVPNMYSPAKMQWNRTATAEAYIRLTEICKRELEEIFGEGSVRGFVWPYYRQENSRVIEYLKANYYGMRDAGREAPLKDGFALPSDRSNWHYNARHSNLLERAAQFEALEDSGELKWLCFGVHSFDFDRSGNWDDLKAFCQKYGNRKEFWYATNAEIFDYEDAVKSVEISGGELINHSDVTLFVKVDGRCVTVAPRGKLAL